MSFTVILVFNTSSMSDCEKNFVFETSWYSIIQLEYAAVHDLEMIAEFQIATYQHNESVYHIITVFTSLSRIMNRKHWNELNI